MKERILNTEHDKKYCINMIKELPLGKDNLVVFKKKDKSLTTRQRNLLHKWFDDVAKSGLGRDDTKPDVKLTAKWMFVKDILYRDDEIFQAIFDHFMEITKDDLQRSEKIKTFTDQYIKTEDLDRKQYVEFMKGFQDYWLDKGVELTDPDKFNVPKDKRGRVR